MCCHFQYIPLSKTNLPMRCTVLLPKLWIPCENLWICSILMGFPSKLFRLLNYCSFWIHEHRFLHLFHYLRKDHFIMDNVIFLIDIVQYCPIRPINSKLLSSLGYNLVPILLQNTTPQFFPILPYVHLSILPLSTPEVSLFVPHCLGLWFSC